MEAHDELKLELLRPRNELTFLLSEQIYSPASEVQMVRRRIRQLLETIDMKCKRDALPLSRAGADMLSKG
jgi:hypothetical protein